MWSKIKSFFGVDSTTEGGEGRDDDDDDQQEKATAKTTADEIRETQQSLNKLRGELDEVEKAIKDSRRLVQKASTQQEHFKTTLSSLEMECHDTFLHPDTDDSDAEEASQAHGAANDNGNDDANSQHPQQGRRSKNKTQLAKAQLRATIHALERKYLPQIEEQKDMLDLTAFRLTLRLSRLKADEADTRRKLLQLQAEAHERWEKYTVTGEEGSSLGLSTDIVPPPSAASSAPAPPAEPDEHQYPQQRQYSTLSQDTGDDEQHQQQQQHEEQTGATEMAVFATPRERGEREEQLRYSIIPPPPPPDVVVKH